MSDYIKREDVLNIIDTAGFWEEEDKEVACTCVNQTPAADVAEVRRGYWSWCTENLYRCTACNTKTRVDECMEEPMYKYCPNCGAKMDKEELPCLD